MRTSVGVSILLAVACTSFGLIPAARAANVFKRLGPAGARVLAATSGTTGAAVRAGEDATLLTVDADAIAAFRAAGGLGTIDRGDRRWTLSPTQRLATHAPGGPGVHAFAPEPSLAAAASRFECGINADNEAQYIVAHPERGLEQGITTSPGATQVNGIRFTFNVAIDCDYEIYANKFAGDLTAATSYILTVLGTVNLIYERDLEATLKFPFVNLWTTAADPYGQPTTSTELNEFQSYWSANMGGVSPNVAHLISG